MIIEGRARELCSLWYDASQKEMVRFATGHDRNPESEVDWREFLAEVRSCYNYVETPTDLRQLGQLEEYAKSKVNER